MAVINMRKYSDLPDTASYVGRYHPKIGFASPYANPFKARQESERYLAILNYEKWLKTQDELLNSLDELEQDLACWCHPKACHAHIIDIVRDMTPEERHQWRTGDFLISETQS